MSEVNENIIEGPPPIIILVNPQLGENIGASARGMWNFGLLNLRLINPRDGWPNSKATAVAAGGGIVLDNLKAYSDLSSGTEDLDYLFATSIRQRGLDKPVLSLEEGIKMTNEMVLDGMKVGILFGPERSGLENKAIASANSIISIPVNPEYGSLNLGQSVLLTSYEWLRSRDQIVNTKNITNSTQLAKLGEIEKLNDHLVEVLEKIGFFFPKAKVSSMKLNLRNTLSRMPLSDFDTRLIHGILRQFARWKNRK